MAEGGLYTRAGAGVTAKRRASGSGVPDGDFAVSLPYMVVKSGPVDDVAGVGCCRDSGPRICPNKAMLLLMACRVVIQSITLSEPQFFVDSCKDYIPTPKLKWWLCVYGSSMISW